MNRIPTVALVACIFLAASSSVSANSPDDERPTPKEQLATLGIDATVTSWSARLFDRTESSTVRCLSALALGHSSNSAALAALLSVIEATSESDPDVRNAAFIGLGFLGDSSSVPHIESALMTESSDIVRYAAVFALAKIGGDMAANVLIRIAEVPQETVLNRISAIEALDRIRPHSIQLISQSLLADDNSSIRAKAAIVLAKVDVSSAIPHLVDAAMNQDLESWVQDDTIRELERVTKQSFTPESSESITFTTQQARAVAVLNIGAWWNDNKQSLGQ